MRRTGGWARRRRALMLGGMRNLCWSLLFYGLFSLAASSQPGPDVAGLTRWASKLSGYPEPAQLPIVQFVTQAQLDAMLEKTGGGGAYMGGRVVYVSMADEDPDEIIVHEIVHYMQMLAGLGHPEMRCAREYEAKRVEWTYRAIVKGESKDFKFPWEWYQCPKPWFNG